MCRLSPPMHAAMTEDQGKQRGIRMSFPAEHRSQCGGHDDAGRRMTFNRRSSEALSSRWINRQVADPASTWIESGLKRHAEVPRAQLAPSSHWIPQKHRQGLLRPLVGGMPSAPHQGWSQCRHLPPFCFEASLVHVFPGLRHHSCTMCRQAFRWPLSLLPAELLAVSTCPTCAGHRRHGCHKNPPCPAWPGV